MPFVRGVKLTKGPGSDPDCKAPHRLDPAGAPGEAVVDTAAAGATDMAAVWGLAVARDPKTMRDLGVGV